MIKHTEDIAHQGTKTNETHALNKNTADSTHIREQSLRSASPIVVGYPPLLLPSTLPKHNVMGVCCELQTCSIVAWQVKVSIYDFTRSIANSHTLCRWRVKPYRSIALEYITLSEATRRHNQNMVAWVKQNEENNQMGVAIFSVKAHSWNSRRFPPAKELQRRQETRCCR